MADVGASAGTLQPPNPPIRSSGAPPLLIEEHIPSHVAAALSRARAAAEERPGRALTPILAAITAAARSGSSDEFAAAEALLDAETVVSGRHALTIAPLLDALAAAEGRDERWIVASIERRLSWVYDFAGDDVAALEMIERARANFAALGDRSGLARSLSNLGVLWTRRGDPAAASEFLDQSMRLADDLGVAMDRARARSNYGYACLLLGEFSKGRQLLEEAISIGASCGHLVRTASLLNLTRLELAETNLNAATTTLDRAVASVDAGNHFGRIESTLLRGQIAAGQERFADAVGCFQTALRMAEDVGALREQAELWQALSAAYESLHDHPSALHALKTAYAMETSLRRERDLLRTAIAAERVAAEQVLHATEQARRHASESEQVAAVLRASRESLRRAEGERDALREQLRAESDTDAATGLASRRRLESALARECERATRFRRPLALALIEIAAMHGPAPSRETHTTAITDATVRELARVVRDHAPDCSMVARHDVQCVAMLMPETNLAQALESCALLRGALSRQAHAVSDASAVIASIGLVSARGGETPGALLARCSDALRTAIAQGGDRVMWEQ